MQNLKEKFVCPDGSKCSSLQSCCRTNDLDEVGDGQHLTYFEMLGNFSFGLNLYEESVNLWDEILHELNIQVDYVTIHPDRDDHETLWKKRNRIVKKDENNVWSDGSIGGYCSEVFSNGIEIGNLVNTDVISVDVGFGFERIVQVVEKKNRVDETDLFDQTLDFIVRDHARCLTSMRENGIIPSNKGRGYVCRKLIRRILNRVDSSIAGIQDWINEEKELRDKCIRNGKRYWNRHKDKGLDFWWETYGIMEEDIELIKS